MLILKNGINSYYIWSKIFVLKVSPTNRIICIYTNPFGSIHGDYFYKCEIDISHSYDSTH